MRKQSAQILLPKPSLTELSSEFRMRFLPRTASVTFKDAMPVSCRSELFTSYILTIFKQRNLLL